jgi:HlyD family secretion protein
LEILIKNYPLTITYYLLPNKKRKESMALGLFSKRANRKLIGLIAVATLISGGIAYYGISQFGQRKTPQPTTTVPTVKKVTALGRIEPEGEVIRLSAPLALDGDRLSQILVQEGDSVQVGQVVAILDSRNRLQDALQQAQEQVKVTQARLAQVKAGAKQGEIQAQQATLRDSQLNLQVKLLPKTQRSLVGDRKFVMLMPSIIALGSCINTVQ